MTGISAADTATQAASPPACVNCGAAIAGAFCANCGQETDVRLPTLRKFMRETTGNVFALDGRLWRTLRALLTQPGFLTREYLRGKRKYYVRPARLYLLTSVILFAVLRLTTEPFTWDESVLRFDVPANRGPVAGSATQGAEFLTLGESLAIGIDRDLHFFVRGSNNVLTEQLRARFDHFNRLPAHDRGKQLMSGLLQYGPYAMFVLLPLFAWLQQVSYFWRADRYPGRPSRYVEHLVYATHLHCVMFLAAALAVLSPWNWARWVILVWVVAFVLRSKHNIYGGSVAGGLLRTLFVVVAYTTFLACALVVLVFPAILIS